MTEKLAPFQRLDNFLKPFREEFNDWVNSQIAETPTDDYKRQYINVSLVRLLGVKYNPMLAAAHAGFFYFVDTIRILQYLDFNHPEILDSARDELLSILHEVDPDFDIDLYQNQTQPIVPPSQESDD